LLSSLFAYGEAHYFHSKSNLVDTYDVVKSVSINDGVLTIDGASSPILYGADFQYFRMRSGGGKNVPRKIVLDLWSKVLDRMIEAGMNSVSISIPWDFHEYAEGKFDFDGTVDEDKDGLADYPSRDIKSLLKMIEVKSFKIVLVRPGPYIKSDWGFAGVGAVPLWFYEKYPDCRMQSPEGLRFRLFDYLDDNFQTNVKLWFQALNREVLSDKLGKGKIIKFIQLDNDTSYLGHNILQLDFSSKSIKRYQNYLRERYVSINAVNRNQGSNLASFDQAKPPLNINETRGKLRDWYDFLDNNTGIYLEKLRRTWESLGVDESQVMFTTADSFTAFDMGILPNSQFRNNVGRTGLMTLNLYPKSYYSYEDSLLNFPYKSDFEIKNAATASQTYLGLENSWVMGSELEFGALKTSYLSVHAKKQILLGALGQGMKAFFVTSFADGWNWQWDWQLRQIQAIKRELKFTDPLSTDQFNQIQAEFDKRHFLGVDVRTVLVNADRDFSTLVNYDTALDIFGNPKEHFHVLKNIGQKIIRPYGSILSVAKPIEDSVAVWRDHTAQSPGNWPEISSASLGSVWSGGLIGVLQQAKMQPVFGMKSVDYTPMTQAKMFFSIEGGGVDANTVVNIASFLKRGGVWVNFLGTSILRQLGLNASATRMNPQTKLISLNYVNIISPAIEIPVLSAPIYSYSITSDKCRNYLTWKNQVIAFICNIESGTFIQIGALFFEDFNSDSYEAPSLAKSKATRLGWFENLFRDNQIIPRVRWGADGVNVSAVTRIWELDKRSGYWVTLRSAGRENNSVKMIFPNAEELLKVGSVASSFQVTEVMSGSTRQVSLKELKESGITFTLPPQGSEAVSIVPILQ
jgi:hypothetical protein